MCRYYQYYVLTQVFLISCCALPPPYGRGRSSNSVQHWCLVVPIQPRLSLQTSPFFLGGLAALVVLILYHYFRLMYTRTPIFTASASFLDKCTTFLTKSHRRILVVFNIGMYSYHWKVAEWKRTAL